MCPQGGASKAAINLKATSEPDLTALTEGAVPFVPCGPDL